MTKIRAEESLWSTAENIVKKYLDIYSRFEMMYWADTSLENLPFVKNGENDRSQFGNLVPYTTVNKHTKSKKEVLEQTLSLNET